MAKRKLKKPQEDTSILLESSVYQSRRKINSFTSPALLFVIIFTVGASAMGWYFVQQQHSLDHLSESFTSMQKRITNLQQVMEMTDAQTDTGLGVEERIFALEEAQKQAQEKAEVALATSEKLKNSNHYSQLWALHDQMDTRLTEIKQAALSVTTLQAMFKNQSEEFEAMKESVVAGLSLSTALAQNVAGLTNTVASACSRADEQVASVETLNAQLAGQASELNELKESMYLLNVALHTINKEMAAIKELVEAKQAMYAQALEEMLSSVQMTLDEQFFTSQTLRSSVMAQLQTFHTQLMNAPSWTMKLKSNGESPAAEFISTTTQNATFVQERLEDVEEQDEQQSAEDKAEDETGEEEKEEDEEEATQEEQPHEQEVEGSIIEEQEEEGEEITGEEITPEDQEDEEITEQSEEQEVAGEITEEEVTEETAESHESLEEEEEEVSGEVVDSWEAEEEKSAELESEVFMDENEEDG